MKRLFLRYNNILFFIGGFTFDALTMVRIDSIVDIAIQTLYLTGISALLILQARVQNGLWAPQGRLAKLWSYETEILHFLYGGLLSAYVVLYFKSTSLSRSLIFLSLVALLMVANEMPQIRRAGSLLRLGLYAFCVVSFLNYLLPVLFGQMGLWVFILAWMLSAFVTYGVVRAVALMTPDPRNSRRRMSVAPAAVLALIFILYATKLIPPVPLSVQYVGIYRNIEKQDGRYKLVYRKPPFYLFWQKDERKFLARPGDFLHCFVRVFAPSRFEHNIYVRWSRFDSIKDRWMSQDRISIPIKGGRDEGFRGVTTKENYVPGRWRVEVESEDGRILSVKDFEVISDDSLETPSLAAQWM